MSPACNVTAISFCTMADVHEIVKNMWPKSDEWSNFGLWLIMARFFNYWDCGILRYVPQCLPKNHIPQYFFSCGIQVYSFWRFFFQWASLTRFFPICPWNPLSLCFQFFSWSILFTCEKTPEILNNLSKQFLCKYMYMQGFQYVLK